MTEVLKGKTVAEARELFAHFHARVTGGEDLPLPEPLAEANAALGGAPQAVPFDETLRSRSPGHSVQWPLAQLLVDCRAASVRCQ